MRSPKIWNRRTFVSTAGLTAAAAISRQPLLSETIAALPKATEKPFLAFVGFAAPARPGEHRVETYWVKDGNWLLTSKTDSCDAPRALVMHPTLPVLYVAHSIGLYLNLPRASISAFTVKTSSGELVPLSREPLALSSTYPEHLAISPNGRMLLVSVSGGGSYNVLSLAADGSIIPGLHVLKQTGCGPHALQPTARPHAAIFHPSAQVVYSSDFGADRLNRISFDNGIPAIASSISFAPGSGPGHVALHPSGNVLVVSSQLRPALTVIALNDLPGRLGAVLQQVESDAEAIGPLSFEPSGNHLYLATKTHSGETRLSTFRMEHGSLPTRATATKRIPPIGHLEQIIVREHELLLVAADGMVTLPVDHCRGIIGESAHVVRASGAACIATFPI